MYRAPQDGVNGPGANLCFFSQCGAAVPSQIEVPAYVRASEWPNDPPGVEKGTRIPRDGVQGGEARPGGNWSPRLTLLPS